MGSTATEPKEHTGRAPDEPLPGDEGAEDRHDEVTQLSIEGDADLSARVGGRRPDEAVIVLQGGEVKMGKTQFDKGQRVRIVSEGYIAEVHDKDIRDPKTGGIASTKKKHVLKVDKMERVPIVDEGAGA
jgi:hypothetical protein